MTNLQPQVVEDSIGMMKERIDFGPKVTLGTFQQVPHSPEDDALEIESFGEVEYKEKDDDLKEEEMPPLDGNYFAMAPVRTVVKMIVLVTMQFTFHLVMAGLIDAVATETTGFLRGTIHGVVVGWVWGLQATLLNFYLQREMRSVEAVSTSVAFGACCTLVALLPTDPPTGFIITAMGGVILHAYVAVGAIFFQMLKAGWKKLDAVKALVYFVINFAMLFIVLFNGLGAMILWPIALSTDYVRQVSGLLLSVDMLVIEMFAVQCVGVIQKKLGHWLPRKHRALASWCIMLIHALTEAYKVCILLYGAIMNPFDMQWLVSSGFSFGINVVNRSFWVRFLAFRRFGVGFPTCIAYMHQHVKFAFGYPRFGGVFTVLLSRLFLHGKGQFFFNPTALAVVIFALACEAAEDMVVGVLPKLGLAPNWKGVGVEKHLRKLPQDSINRRFNIDKDTGALSMGVPIVPFESPLICVGIANATVFLCYTGLITLVSMPFLLGVCEYVPQFTLKTGFGVLMENGALFWPLRNESACPLDKDSR